MLCLTALGVSLMSTAPSSIKLAPRLIYLRTLCVEGAATVVETSDMVSAVKVVKFKAAMFLTLFLVVTKLVFKEIFNLLA